MTELPPELASRRAAIHDRVVRRGIAMRRRRWFAVSMGAALVVALPVAAVGLSTAGENATRRVEAIAPRNGGVIPTTSAAPTTSTTQAPTSTETPTTTTVPPTTVSTSATTMPTLICRNSTEPACGPFQYDPPITNQPATLTVVSVEPSAPNAGEKVAFTLHASDPDSFIPTDESCGPLAPAGIFAFGDGARGGCVAGCAAPGPQYGPWTPPPPIPGDATFTLEHAYPKTGSFTADFVIVADECGPRHSEASISVMVHIVR
jgi:hypothetical protein